MLEFIVVSCNHDFFNYDVICSASVAKAEVQSLKHFWGYIFISNKGYILTVILMWSWKFLCKELINWCFRISFNLIYPMVFRNLLLYRVIMTFFNYDVICSASVAKAVVQSFKHFWGYIFTSIQGLILTVILVWSWKLLFKKVNNWCFRTSFSLIYPIVC